MKLIVVGATGFVGSELVRQSLRRSDVSAVIAVSRRPLPASTEPTEGVNIAKLKSVVVKDYDQYSDEARKEFAGASACIWTIAVTPSKVDSLPFEEVTRICQTSTMVGLRAMFAAGVAKPFRFIYMSGFASERDQSKIPSFKPEYTLMRGETENQVLAFAAEHKGDIEVTVARPGLILEPWNIPKRLFSFALKWTMGVPSIWLAQISTAMLDQVLYGFEKDPLTNEDLVRLAEESTSKA